MKKHIFLALVCALTLVGCQEKTPEYYFHKITVKKTVKQSDWRFDNQEKLFFCEFKVPEITHEVYKEGSWTVNREYLPGTANAFQAALPLNRFLTDTLQEDVMVYYTQYIDYRIGVGYVEIQLTNSDYYYGEENPEEMHFRLQANDAILDLTIMHDDWKYDKYSEQYYYHFDVPEITEDVYNYGHWSIAREYNYGTSDAYQVDLPTSCFMTETLTDNPVVYYTQKIDYAIGEGRFLVMLTNSDYYYELDKKDTPIPPEEMYFRLQITY